MDEERLSDVEIGAWVRAKKVRFERKPEIEVSFPDDPEVESDSGSERENLPDEVRPGETYEDVQVRWWAAAWRRDDGEGA